MTSALLDISMSVGQVLRKHEGWVARYENNNKPRYDKCLFKAWHVPVWPGMFEYDRWPVSVKARRRATSWPGPTVASSRASDAVGDFYLLSSVIFFLSQFLDCDHGECQFYGMQGFSSPLFLFSAAAVCIGIGLSETDPALLSLLPNDFLSASSKEPPPPRHLFALPPKGKIDTYWLNLIFINNRTSKKRSDIFLTFR